MQTESSSSSDLHSEHDSERAVEPEQPVSLSYFAHVLHAYKPTIVIALAAVALLYAIIALGTYVFTGAERVTVQNFRLDFDGASEGKFPNGNKFTVADIVSQPVLARVHRENRLADYISAAEFTRSVFVLESNRAYDDLAAKYQARLTDPRLTPIERDQILREFDLKRQSISKNDYALFFRRTLARREVPEAVARKVLLDILNDWSDFAVNQQHVTSYAISVPSPNVVATTLIESSSAIASIQVLREKANRVIQVIDELMYMPSANQVRTNTDHVSLGEVRLHLEEVIRFGLDPLLPVVASSGLISDTASTIRFVETQLAFDERMLESKQREADAIRQAIVLYAQPQGNEQAAAVMAATPDEKKPAGSSQSSVMPQLSDTFLDRIMSLSGRSADVEYRQKLADDYRKAVMKTIPWHEALAYDKNVLEDLRGGRRVASQDPNAVRAQIERFRADIASSITKVNELYQTISRNMTPSTQLLTITAPASSQTLRSVNLKQLALYGVLALLISLPAILAFCLIHNRIRTEEVVAEREHAKRSTTSHSAA